MNNNTNDLDPILDFILQNDNKETNKPISNELLGFLLSDDSSLFPPQQSLQTPQPLLPTITTTATTTTATNASASTTQEVRSPPYKRQRYSSNSNSSPSEEDDEPTDAQLKMMPSKERRQLRNKISARNFRNRRKEYMADLEERMDKCQAENSQLKLEVKWVRDMMDKLQAENDRLRLELVLCKGGIQHPLNIETSPTTVVSPPPFSSGTNTAPSSNWDLVYPPSDTNIYLAHASIPDWDLTSLFEKPKPTPAGSSRELIRNYPLLAPALMSIVLRHTMTMTTEEMMKHAQLTDPSLPAFTYQPEDKFVNALSDTVLWKQITNLPVITEETETETESNNQSTEIQDYMMKKCPLMWVQKQFCKFVLLYVVVKYPQLDKPCRTYLPICEKFRMKKTASY